MSHAAVFAMTNGSRMRGPWGIGALVLGAAALCALLWVSMRRQSSAATTTAPGSSSDVPASVRAIGTSTPAVAKRRAVEETCRSICAGELRACEVLAAEVESTGPSCADRRRTCEARCVDSTR